MKYVKIKIDPWEYSRCSPEDKKYIERETVKRLYMQLSETFLENANYRVKWQVDTDQESGVRTYLAICEPLTVETRTVRLLKYDNDIREMKLNFWERLVYLFTKKVPKRYRINIPETLLVKSCDTCVKKHKSECPNSEKCYATEEKPYWEGRTYIHD